MIEAPPRVKAVYFDPAELVDTLLNALRWVLGSTAATCKGVTIAIYPYWETTGNTREVASLLRSRQRAYKQLDPTRDLAPQLRCVNALIWGNPWQIVDQQLRDVVTYVRGGGGLLLGGLGWSWQRDDPARYPYPPGRSLATYPANRLAAAFGFAFSPTSFTAAAGVRIRPPAQSSVILPASRADEPLLQLRLRRRVREEGGVRDAVVGVEDVPLGSSIGNSPAPFSAKTPLVGTTRSLCCFANTSSMTASLTIARSARVRRLVVGRERVVGHAFGRRPAFEPLLELAARGHRAEAVEAVDGADRDHLRHGDDARQDVGHAVVREAVEDVREDVDQVAEPVAVGRARCRRSGSRR